MFQSRWMVLAAPPLLAGSAHAAIFASALPAGAVVAFTPATVCEKLPGGWRAFSEADGRVVVGAAPGLPAAGASAAPADYWTRGVALKTGMIPRTPITGAGPTLVTAPELSVKSDATPGLAAAFSSPTPDTRLFGYRFSPPAAGGSEALPAGYGAPGAVGKDPPDPLPVAPPFIALRYCVKT